MITQCQVQYIVKDIDEDWVGGDVTRGQEPLTWRVFLDHLEHVCTDFVVLSCMYALNKMSLRYKTQSQSYIFVNQNFCLTAAGVLGTTQILFQSERRGLKISDRLGMAFSTNGNNFAYLARSLLPLNGQGLSKEQFSNIPKSTRTVSVFIIYFFLRVYNRGKNLINQTSW